MVGPGMRLVDSGYGVCMLRHSRLFMYKLHNIIMEKVHCILYLMGWKAGLYFQCILKSIRHEKTANKLTTLYF